MQQRDADGDDAERRQQDLQRLTHARRPLERI
jgi:hypothetical protein